MKKDIRQIPLYRDAAALCREVRQPGSGSISDAVEVSTNGRQAVFTGTLVQPLDGAPPTHICLTDLATGETRVQTFGPNTDRSPKFSPDGRSIAFLSDRHQAGDFQLYLLDPASGRARPAPAVGGWVEYLHWSPNGRKILLGCAGRGADTAGAHGALSRKEEPAAVPSWMPAVETGDESLRRRGVWIYECDTERVHQVGPADVNIWEAAWCGDEALAAVCSAGAGEALWYSARLCKIDVGTATSHELYAPRDQLGWPAASPSGQHLAFVEGISSDRWVVAGQLRLIQIASSEVLRVDTRGIDVTYVEWRGDHKLLVAGHRGFESVIALHDASTGAFTELWASSDVCTTGTYITVAGIDASGDCVLIGEGFRRAPEIAVIRDGNYRTIKSLGLSSVGSTDAMAAVEQVSWRAPDGLEIQGWLLQPAGRGPFPLVMNVHGGPVSHWRPRWLGHPFLLPVLLLLKRGYAVFLPNPRGSSGRGQDFARHVLGERCGADTYDNLSGLDYLVSRDIADRKRLGVMGGSYGGVMTSWLVAQDSRFAAAVSLSAVANYFSARFLSNVPVFFDLYLADKYTNHGGKYFQRSPLMHAHKVKTPVLNVCGALDRCTPAVETLQFHNALLEHGVESVLVTYPEEGHGIRKYPAAIDYAARVVSWFEQHMPAGIG